MSSYDLMDINQTIVKTAMDMGFADAWIHEGDNIFPTCLVTISPYTDHKPAKAGCIAVSNYYITSNTAYHRTRELENALRLFGVKSKMSHVLPARAIAVAHKGFIGKNGFYFHPEHGSMVYIGTVELHTQDDKTANVARFIGNDKNVARFIGNDKNVARFENKKNENVVRFEDDFGNVARFCAGCGRCADVCPTGALANNDMSLCLREHILKNPIPEEIAPHITQLYGCELCQLVCPINNVAQKKPTEFNCNELLNGEHFNEIRSLVGKNIAKRANIISQVECYVRNMSRHL